MAAGVSADSSFYFSNTWIEHEEVVSLKKCKDKIRNFILSLANKRYIPKIGSITKKDLDETSAFYHESTRESLKIILSNTCKDSIEREEKVETCIQELRDKIFSYITLLHKDPTLRLDSAPMSKKRDYEAYKDDKIAESLMEGSHQAVELALHDLFYSLGHKRYLKGYGSLTSQDAGIMGSIFKDTFSQSLGLINQLSSSSSEKRESILMALANVKEMMLNHLKPTASDPIVAELESILNDEALVDELILALDSNIELSLKELLKKAYMKCDFPAIVDRIIQKRIIERNQGAKDRFKIANIAKCIEAFSVPRDGYICRQEAIELLRVNYQKILKEELKIQGIKIKKTNQKETVEAFNAYLDSAAHGLLVKRVQFETQIRSKIEDFLNFYAATT